MIPQLTPELAKRSLVELWKNEQREKRRRERAEFCRVSFRDFVADSWETVEPAKAFMPSWHIDAICDHMQSVDEGHIKNLLITVPPGSAKSILVSVMFPAWVWTHNPGWRSTFSSYDAGLSTRDSVRCRGLLESAWYQDSFKPSWEFSPDQNEKTFYANTEKGFRVSMSVGGRGTGWRGHGIFCDDPLNVSDQFSDAALDQCIFWWDNVIFNRLNDMRTGTKVIIMQRICDRDLAGHWLRSGACEHLMIPMEYDPVRSKVTTLAPGKEWRDPRTHRDELMFPALFPRAVVDEIKKDPARFAGQYQQAPNVEGGGILKAHKWNYWQPPGAGLPPVRVRLPDGTIEERRAVDLPDVFDLELQTWDMAVKDLKSSDYVVGQVHAVRGACRYIRSQTRDRMDLPTTILAIRRMSGDYPRAHLKLVEDKANGPAAIQMLRGEISGLVEVNPEGGKVSRASGASIELEAGNWFLPHPMIAPWVGEPGNPTKGGFLAETVLFPNGQNDDCVDAWSQGAIRIKQEKIGGAFGVSEQDIRVEPIAIGDNWPRIYGLCIDWQEVAAIWLARKPDTGEHYLYVEYDAPVSDPTQHAGEILKRGDWINGVMAAKDTGRQQKDGFAIVQKYNSLRLNLEAVLENWDTAMLEMQEGLRTGKLKVFSNLPRFFDQYRLFRRDSRDKLPEENSGLIWAACTAWRARTKMKALAVPKKATGRGYSNEPAGNGWMAG